MTARRKLDEALTFSQRERDVLVLLCKGKRSAEVAATIGCSESVVHAHRSNVMQKIGCKSPVELGVWAARSGLLDAAERDSGTREDILTKSGQYFDFLHPERYQFDVKDIAHALSMTCRFSGQCSKFYSVAQHSVYVSRIVPAQDAFAGLMHDCAEAFVGDVTRPLKRMLTEYRVIEKRVEAALFMALGLPATLPASVKHADKQMLAAEQAALMPPHSDEWAVLQGISPPAGLVITPLLPREAYRMFMARYDELRYLEY